MKLKNKLLTSSLHNKTGEIPPRVKSLADVDYGTVERRFAAHLAVDMIKLSPQTKEKSSK